MILALQGIIAVYLLLPSVLLVLYGFLKLGRAKKPFQKKPFLTDHRYEFGIIITAHQELDFVVPLMDSIRRQTYPHFQVYVVADDCSDTSGLRMADDRFQVLYPQPALHAKIKSIHYALDHFIRLHDAVIILDADNLIHPDFLRIMNEHFQKGYKVVQCDFKPKNTDSLYARMDAIGDMYNFFTEREVRMWLNLSATIWGSGVAMDRNLYTQIEYKDMFGGFDRKLQAHLVKLVDRIGFSTDAILYDEKISSGKSLENQRTRWLSAYFKYFRESLGVLLSGLQRGNFNLIFFGFNNIRPPLFILLGMAFVAAVIGWFVDERLFIVWLIVLFQFILSFVLIVWIKSKDFRFVRTIAVMPLFIFRQFIALLRIRKAKKSFLKTHHSKLVYIDELLKKLPVTDER